VIVGDTMPTFGVPIELASFGQQGRKFIAVYTLCSSDDPNPIPSLYSKIEYKLFGSLSSSTPFIGSISLLLCSRYILFHSVQALNFLLLFLF
jgi:hypothetical protein